MTTLTYSHLSNCLSRLDGISSMCAIFTIHRTRWSINWPTSVKPLDHYTVYIGNVVIGNWLILTRLEEQTTALININIMLLVEAACPFVCLFDCCQRQNLLQTASIIIHRKSHTVSVHLYLSLLQQSKAHQHWSGFDQPSGLLVWPSDEGLLIISSFNENSTGVAMCVRY